MMNSYMYLHQITPYSYGHYLSKSLTNISPLLATHMQYTVYLAMHLSNKIFSRYPGSYIKNVSLSFQGKCMVVQGVRTQFTIEFHS